MKLNMGDRIKYDGSVYTVAAVLFSTVYLRMTKDDNTNFDYIANDVYKYYRDFEFLK